MLAARQNIFILMIETYGGVRTNPLYIYLYSI